MKTRTVVIVMAAVFGVAGIVTAQEALQVESAAAPEVDESFSVDTVSGEVSGVTARSISVVYDRDYDTGTEYEIVLPYEATTQIKHKKSVKEIKVGDLISIEYEKPGPKSQKMARARSITFLQSGIDPASLRSKDVPE